MSKYTTELRFICESKAPTKTKYTDVIEAARAEIFNFYYPIFNEGYRQNLETKILKHFYTREIGFEVYGLFHLKLDEKLNLIMPFYNKMYTAAETQFNILSTEAATDTEENTQTTLGTATAESGNVGNGVQKFTDTPQGTLENLTADKNMSAATITDNTNTTNSNATNTNNATATFIRSYTGYKGAAPADLLQKYYDSLVNVDKLVLAELDELFMQIW